MVIHALLAPFSSGAQLNELKWENYCNEIVNLFGLLVLQLALGVFAHSFCFIHFALFFVNFVAFIVNMTEEGIFIVFYFGVQLSMEMPRIVEIPFGLFYDYL